MAVREKDLTKRFVARSFNQLAKSAYGGNWSGVENYMAQLSKPLAKALATSAVPGFADGSNLVLQNLDSIMTSVLFTEDQLVKQRFIERVPSINPIFQWNRRNQYGSSRGTMAFAEGGIGPVGNGSWARNTAPVKFFGIQRGTTVIANLAGALGGMFDNPVEEEEYDGTMQLLGGVERALIWGNSTIVDSGGNDIFYDGFYRQLKANRPKNIIDMHGKPMTFDVISEIAALYAKAFVTSARNVGAFLSPDTIATLQLMKQQAERNNDMSSRDGGFAAGTPLDGYRTQIGWIPFIQDVFTEPVDNGRSPLTTADSGAPGAVTTVTAAVAAPGAGQTSNWQSGDAGTVYYTVGAFNAQGEAVGYLYTTGVNALANDVVTLTITNVTGALGYRIYRGTQSNGSDAQWIGEVAATGTATVPFVDDNSIMPGTDVGLFVEKSPQNLVMAQMAPLLKLPFAIQNTTIPFGLLYLHTLAIKAIERQFLVINIGRTGYTS
ncbi:hypothetical protein LSG31_00410 [Fodinisporobacter ferrooxydans]|uniref:Uncharacterized protein n=1 Tax=Fodinisporobacter ferrooxydans TaxID=2901836 RepID=A0ABY4CSD3_9BACL|nr:hypothetical protein LSG31_00410 [Alicyclobacillaceae bacterium MYW30-H2]